MQRFIDDPDDVVDDMLAGFLLAHGSEVQLSAENHRVVHRRSAADIAPRVGLVTGGGSGHEPAFLGYLGAGMLDAVAVGEVFSSPVANAFLDAMRIADRGRGVACLFGNYAGDSMNVQMALKQARELGHSVAIVKARDDIASAPPERAEQRHGIAGGIFMWKAAGAVAAAGGSLEETVAAASLAANNTRSVCVGLAPCAIPAVGKPNFAIADGTYEFGIGHHGEAGSHVSPLAKAEEIAAVMVEALLDDFSLAEEQREFAVMVSGLGATPLMEQYLMAGRIGHLLTLRGHRLWRSYVGNYVTSLEMNGLCLTLLLLDDALKTYLDAPAAAVGLASL